MQIELEKNCWWNTEILYAYNILPADQYKLCHKTVIAIQKLKNASSGSYFQDVSAHD